MKPGWVEIAVEAAIVAEPELAALALEDRDAAPAPGGAAVGRVVAAGEGAEHLVGRRVLVGPLAACGECERCRRGAPFACTRGEVLGQTTAGALAGTALAPARWLCPLAGGDSGDSGDQQPGALDLPGPLSALVPREAVDAYALCARASVAAGEPVIVVGRGPVAALAMQLAAARGARPVRVSAHGPGGLEGAHTAVRAHLEERGAANRPTPVLAASSDPVNQAAALALAGPGSLVAILARPPLLPEATPAAQVAALLTGGGALLAVPAGHPDLMPEVAALAVRGELDLAACAEVAPAGPPADMLARARQALAAGRALVVSF